MLIHILFQCLLMSLTYCISSHPILIIVSYDAFRYDYFETKPVPHMNRIRKLGTYADYLVNIFPTKTFPNHYTIATGLYAETHGVLDNIYYDAKKQKVIHFSYEMFHYNDNIVPIWRRNEDAGSGRHSGVMMWPGGCFAYQTKNITYCQDYEHNFDWFKYVDTAVKWIQDPIKPANLVLMYFDEPDNHGHKVGTNDPEIINLIRKLDNITLYIEQQLENSGLKDKVNVIHLSDHGMLNVKSPHFLNVTQYLTSNTYNYAGTSPIFQFFPKKGYENETYSKLLQGSKVNGHFKVYKKADYPERWHYRNNDRAAPLIVMADAGYALDDLINLENENKINVTDNDEFGVHGYDTTEKAMLPFFMARGPKIKTNHKVPPFNTVDLYYLFCQILEITPSENNGTLANILDILNQQVSNSYSVSSVLILTVGAIFTAIFLISCTAFITLVMIKRQQRITTTAALNKRFPQTFQSNYEAQHLLEPEEA